MVLGYILYETVDLGISLVKLTYKGVNGMYGMYKWWTSAPSASNSTNTRTTPTLTNSVSTQTSIANI